MTRIKTALRSVVDRSGVVHKLIYNASIGMPAMLSARCGKPVASRAKLIRYVKEPPTCLLCLSDDWEP